MTDIAAFVSFDRRARKSDDGPTLLKAFKFENRKDMRDSFEGHSNRCVRGNLGDNRVSIDVLRQLSNESPVQSLPSPELYSTHLPLGKVREF